MFWVGNFRRHGLIMQHGIISSRGKYYKDKIPEGIGIKQKRDGRIKIHALRPLFQQTGSATALGARQTGDLVGTFDQAGRKQ
jgi:hypothetical protein